MAFRRVRVQAAAGGAPPLPSRFFSFTEATEQLTLNPEAAFICRIGLEGDSPTAQTRKVDGPSKQAAKAFQEAIDASSVRLLTLSHVIMNSALLKALSKTKLSKLTFSYCTWGERKQREKIIIMLVNSLADMTLKTLALQEDMNSMKVVLQNLHRYNIQRLQLEYIHEVHQFGLWRGLVWSNLAKLHMQAVKINQGKPRFIRLVYRTISLCSNTLRELVLDLGASILDTLSLELDPKENLKLKVTWHYSTRTRVQCIPEKLFRSSDVIKLEYFNPASRAEKKLVATSLERNSTLVGLCDLDTERRGNLNHALRKFTPEVGNLWQEIIADDWESLIVHNMMEI